jgi:hypothetical protein
VRALLGQLATATCASRFCWGKEDSETSVRFGVDVYAFHEELLAEEGRIESREANSQST